MQFIERLITAEARKILHNPKLRVKDIQEWNTRPFGYHEGEVLIYLDQLKIHVAYKKECDKRK